MNEFFNKYPLGISNPRVEENIQLEDGRAGHAVWIDIRNNTDKRLSIEVEDTYMLDCGNREFTADDSCEGFVIDETTIRPGTCKTVGRIFLGRKFKSIEAGFRFGIVVVDVVSYTRYSAEFCLELDWELLGCEITEVNTPKRIVSRLAKSIERLEAFEGKLGVRFDSINVTYNPYLPGRFSVRGDIYSVAQEPFEGSFCICANLYNGEGELLDQGRDYHSRGSFEGYLSFCLDFFVDWDEANEIERIRLYLEY